MKESWSWSNKIPHEFYVLVASAGLIGWLDLTQFNDNSKTMRLSLRESSIDRSLQKSLVLCPRCIIIYAVGLLHWRADSATNTAKSFRDCAASLGKVCERIRYRVVPKHILGWPVRSGVSSWACNQGAKRKTAQVLVDQALKPAWIQTSWTKHFHWLKLIDIFYL